MTCTPVAKPRAEQSEGKTIKDLCNLFWNTKRAAREAGEIAARTFHDYEQITDLATQHFGKGRLIEDVRPGDFTELRIKLARKWGPVSVGNAITPLRVLFKFAFDSGRIEHPMRFGPGFKRPSKKTLRLEKAKSGKKLFEGDEIRNMVKTATRPLRAMILLGINCGFGNADCGTLPMTAVALGRRDRRPLMGTAMTLPTT